MPTHENAPKRESNRAILAHVREVMDEPRMSESAREQEEESEPEQGAGVGKAAPSHRAKGRKTDDKANHGQLVTE